MKSDIHPEYRDVVFQDSSSDLRFVTRSTIETQETIEFEGKEYPLAKVEISSESHPFYTGKQILLDAGGRVERFRRRYAKSGAGQGGAATAADVADAAAAESAEATASADEAVAEASAETTE